MKKMILSMVCLAVIGLMTPFVVVEAAAAETKAGGVKSLEDRVAQLEDAIGRDVAGPSWFDRIQISGVIEVEANYQTVDDNDPATDDEDSSDVDLATVELAIDARIVDHVDGHVLFKYEEDDVFVDEGFITLTGSEAFPAYLIAGRQYVPFGNYDSHFVTDPNTLVLGETNEGALVLGYRIGGDLVDIAVGAFNSKIGEAGDDDMIDGYVASVSAQPLEGLTLGVSYISDLTSSDSFSETVTDRDSDGEVDPVEKMVAGWSAFVTFEFLDRFRLIGEYTAALDEFVAGEIYDNTETLAREPSAWNVEFGVMVIDALELAVRYGGSDDGGEFLPETQYGGVVNWGFFDNTNLALEYMHDEYENDGNEVETITAQLAVEF